MSKQKEKNYFFGIFIANFMSSLIREQIVVGKPNSTGKPLRLYTDSECQTKPDPSVLRFWTVTVQLALKETMAFKNPDNSQVCACHQVSLYKEEKWQTDCMSLLPDPNQVRGKFVQMGKYGGMLLLIERKQLLKQKMQERKPSLRDISYNKGEI